MPDRYQNFAALQAECREGQDYRIHLEDRGERRILVFSPHAGGIEPGTSALVRAIAGSDLSYYLFEGIRAANNTELHITSHHFDEPGCVALIGKFETSLAVHGCNGEKRILYVGGTNQILMETLRTNLSRQVEVRSSDGTGLEGRDSMNICNRTASGAGVQLEFSTGLRRALLGNLERGLQVKSPEFLDLVAQIRQAILGPY